MKHAGNVVTMLVVCISLLVGCGGGGGTPPDQDDQPDGPVVADDTIVFSDGNQLLSIHPDGTGRTPLTSPAASTHAPAWSPDKSQIAYGTDHELRTTSANGGEQPIVIANLGSDWLDGLSWSPVGSHIVYCVQNNRAVGYTWTMYTTEIDGLERRVVIDGVDLNEDGYMLREPAWSPDGSIIAFVGGPDLDMSIYTVRTDGTELTHLTEVKQGSDQVHPQWSPDGEKIAFIDGQHDEAEICTMNSDGTNVQSVMQTGQSIFDLSWSPDGTKIAFLAPGDSCEDPARLYEMNPDGTGLRMIAEIECDYCGWYGGLRLDW